MFKMSGKVPVLVVACGLTALPSAGCGATAAENNVEVCQESASCLHTKLTAMKGTVDEASFDAENTISDIHTAGELPKGVTIVGEKYNYIGVDVASDAEQGTFAIPVEGKKCSSPDSDKPPVCTDPFNGVIDLTVTGLSPAPRGESTTTTPSRDRTERATPIDGSSSLGMPDEMTVVMKQQDDGDSIYRDEADKAAETVGATVVGALESIGFFQFRWEGSPNLDEMQKKLEQNPNVEWAHPSTLTKVGLAGRGEEEYGHGDEVN